MSENDSAKKTFEIGAYPLPASMDKNPLSSILRAPLGWHFV